MTKLIELTEEQEKICSSNSSHLQVNAFAGTGKTTTLWHYAKMHPREKLIYICYNKSIQLEAEKYFPPNVKCKTSHSIAYGLVGHKYKDKLVSFLTTPSLIASLKLHKSKNPELFSQLIIDTVNNFIYSDLDEITETHLPQNKIELIFGAKSDASKEMADRINSSIIVKSKELWNKMQDVNDNNIGMTHDGYLKLLHLNTLKLPYDIIMLDEAQDTNPATLKFLKRQYHAGLVFIGDTHQSIYQFRGAKDAFKNKDGFDILPLSTSFRFGEELANISNAILAFKNETTGIVGHGKTTIFKNKDFFKTPKKEEDKRIAHIFRNNPTLLNYLFEKIDRGAIKKFFVEGGVNNYNIGQLIDIYKIFNKEKPTDPLLQLYPSFEELKSNAKNVVNASLLGQCLLVEKFKHKIPKLLSLAKSLETKNASESEVILTNTHKSKGREYANVKIHLDFDISPFNPYIHYLFEKEETNQPMVYAATKNKKLSAIPEKYFEELNVVYVAITRTKNNLILPEEYYDSASLLGYAYKNGFDEHFFQKCKTMGMELDPILRTNFENNILERNIKKAPEKSKKTFKL